MTADISILAVVTARGGSKGIPGKNIAPVGGLPLIVHTLRAARAAHSLQRLVVSTDSEEIAAVCRAEGAEVPFLRPAELAQDSTPGPAPVVHAVRWLEEQEGYRPDYVMLLQPTSPLRSAEDIDNAAQLARLQAPDSVVSVTPARTHPYWAKRIAADGRLEAFVTPDRPYPRRQDLPPAYALNGAIYLARRGLLLESGSFYGERTLAYVMPVERSLDVDSAWDLHLVDLALSHPQG